MNTTKSDVVAVGRVALPYDFVSERVASEYFVAQNLQVVTLICIKVNIDCGATGHQLLDQQEPLVHELQVRVVRPDVRVLDLFAQRVALTVQSGCPGRTAQLNLPDVVRPGIERWIDVDAVSYTHLRAHETGRNL